MTDSVYAGRVPRSEPRAQPTTAPGPMAGGVAERMLSLQRTAGNRAARHVARALAARPQSAAPPRLLQRCGAGGCTCGGACGRHGAQDDEDERLRTGFAALQRAVVARRALARDAANAFPGRPPAATALRSPPAPTLQRKLKVDKPGTPIPNPSGSGVTQTNAATIQSYLQTLCGAGAVAIDATTGAVALSAGFCTAPTLSSGAYGPPSPAPSELSKTPVGCGCLCDMIGSAHLWTIVVDDKDWPHTDFDSHADASKPGGTGGKVTAPSPNSPKLWGAGTRTGAAVDIDPWLVLGHELCGHAWLGDHGAHGPDEAAPRGQGGHQETIGRENRIRAEHGIELRGGFKDPNCGESYYRDKASPGTVNWSGYRATCIAWRNSYNAAHGTSYGINDRIP